MAIDYENMSDAELQRALLVQALRAGQNASPDFNALYRTATPDELKALAESGTIGDQGEQLAAQLTQANLLRNKPMAPHTTGIGAALGGLGNVIGGIQGGLQANSIQKQMADLLHKKSDASLTNLNLFRRAGMGSASLPPGASGMGTGGGYGSPWGLSQLSLDMPFGFGG